MKFTFVILHYMTYIDTSECIDSIINNIDYSNYEIIVVDNNSKNNSLNLLENKYASLSNIHFLKNNKNIGFAKGNNKGYNFAKKQLNADFIVMINNDTIIRQSDFIKKTITIFNKYMPYIIGPDIITSYNQHQNPQREKCLTEKEIKKLIFRNKIYSYMIKTKTEKIIRKSYWFIKKILGIEPSFKNNQLETDNWKSVQHNVELHGSCLIFSPLYVDKYKGLYDETFMYMEENILYYISTKENIDSLYHPDIKIFHKEDASTNAIFKKENNKRLFVYKNINKSAKILLKIMKNNNIYKSNIIE